LDAVAMLPPQETASARPAADSDSDAIDARGPAPTQPRVHVGTRWILFAGGGAETYLHRQDGGAAVWTAALHFAPREHVGLELAYIGTANSDLRTTSLEAVGQWIPWTSGELRPYAFAGVGWRRLHAPEVQDVATLPLGTGLTFERGRWRLDTRITLRPTSKQSHRSLGAAARLGIAF
jgi:hypothetical protein